MWKMKTGAPLGLLFFGSVKIGRGVLKEDQLYTNTAGFLYERASVR